MVKYGQMKHLASITALILSACAYAEHMVVPSLPDPLRPRAEAETNVTFSAGAAGDNLWRLSVELDASVSNSVEVVLGIDADGDGALAVEEGELVVGWRCGRWFWRDRRANAVGEVSDVCGARRLDWTVRLNGERQPRSVAGNVFDGGLPPTCFSAAWNMARVVSRGSDTVHVEGKVSVDALELRVR